MVILEYCFADNFTALSVINGIIFNSRPQPIRRGFSVFHLVPIINSSPVAGWLAGLLVVCCATVLSRVLSVVLCIHKSPDKVEKRNRHLKAPRIIKFPPTNNNNHWLHEWNSPPNEAHCVPSKTPSQCKILTKQDRVYSQPSSSPSLERCTTRPFLFCAGTARPAPDPSD